MLRFLLDFPIATYTLWLPAKQFGIAEQQLFPVAGHVFHPQMIPDKIVPSASQTVNKMHHMTNTTSACWAKMWIQVRYRKGPLSQKSAHAEQYAQTKTNTNPDPDRYRRRCPDPNARIQKFIHYMAIAAICDSGPLR